MTHRLNFIHRFRFSWSAAIVATILALSAMGPGQIPSGHAQTPKPAPTEQTLTQIKQDTDEASTLSRKLDKQIRRLRTVVVVSLALTAVILVVLLVVVIYLVVQKRSADTTISAGSSILRWKAGRDDTARILHRQRKLARAVSDLQDFADQSRESNSELSVLLNSVRKRLKELDPPTASPEMPAAKL